MAEPAEEDDGASWVDIVVAVALVAAAIVYWISSVQRARREKREAEELQALLRKMRVAERSDWLPEDLRAYTGGTDEDQQPILIAAKDVVYNVWRGREFYGRDAPYELFAGRDATRFLARELLDEEDPEEERRPLTRSELAVLDEWIATFEWKYDRVGTLKPGTSLWSKEAAKRAEWQVFTARFLPYALAAAVDAASVVTVTHIPRKGPAASAAAAKEEEEPDLSSLSIEERLRRRAAAKGR
eukprot:TRINITY_DN17044_c0_g1_i1.p1 TRINITY_DN17044_c0_g1~~TRINITY_DN17044_c0_g1_i1.p1  ORF type:complete len:264 (+),score=99.62 TRINITY_DN17044_c0_g1_i1:67-792(+)